jgi:hypothetical protein
MASLEITLPQDYDSKGQAKVNREPTGAFSIA